MRGIVVVVLAIVLAVSIAPAFAGSKPASVTIPKYTVVPVTLDDTISTKKNKTGDTFQVHCMGPDCGGFPSGTTFVGVLTITPAQKHEPATGSAKFTQAILPDQRKIWIDAAPSTAEGVKKEGTTAGKSKNKARNTGAAVGGAIGALTGWGHGGVVVGAAVGAAAGQLSKGQGKDLEFKAGTKGYMVMLQPVTIPPAK
jgi:hypothetical protein